MTARRGRAWLAGGLALLLAACATHGERLAEGRQALRAGKLEQAEESFAEKIPAEGDTALLHHLERGTLAHLRGDYQRSNRHLGEAERIADARRDRLAEQRGQALLTNPTNAPYRPIAVERIFINYFRLLNYTFLAQDALAAGNSSAALRNLDSARVEARRIQLQLDALVRRKGGYDDAEAQRKKLYGKLLRLFEVLRGQWADTQALVYRDDAYLRYLTGVVYEQRGEWDNARLAYERAAELYASGYARQYDLGRAMAERARLDTARVMAIAGGYGNRLADLKAKLDPAARKQLETRLAARDDGKPRGELVVLNHVGLIPPRRELNLHFYVDEASKAFVLRPVLSGTEAEKQRQLGWFFTQYADTGALHIAKNYMAGGAYDAVSGLVTKRFPLGPAWDTAKDLKLPQAVGPWGIRVAVPYYPPTGRFDTYSRLSLAPAGGGKPVAEKKLRAAEALDRIALQTQLLASGEALRAALAREMAKNLAAEGGSAAVASLAGDGWGVLAELASRIAASATAKAETRGWLTLPRRIQIARVPVAPGRYELAVTTHDRRDRQLAAKRRTVRVAAGELAVARVRSLAPAAYRPPRAPGGFTYRPEPKADAGAATPRPVVLPSEPNANQGERP